MLTELAQLISLTSYGNEFLYNNNIESNYYPENNIFKNCNPINFIVVKKRILSKKRTEKIIETNPLNWYQSLKKEGCKKLRVYYKPAKPQAFAPEYMFAGFANGAATWCIESIYKSYSNYWQKRWVVASGPPNTVWKVSYGRLVGKQPTSDIQFNLDQLRTKFEKLLSDLIEFCSKQNLKFWFESFSKADKVLHSFVPAVETDFSNYIVLKNYPLDVQQLFLSACCSWVFGGMGSWNDMGFKEKETNDKYKRMTQELYNILIQIYLGTINSY